MKHSDHKLNRRDFLKSVSLAAPLILTATAAAGAQYQASAPASRASVRTKEFAADLVIIGGGVGGCAAALAAARNGLQVIVTEETDWIGGQLAQQAVPPNENKWIETFGGTRSY